MDIDIENRTTAEIYAAWRRRGMAELPRVYLGASICSHECDRYLWLYFRGAVVETHEGRMYRLFDRGRREEEVFANDLRSIGCTVWTVDPSTNEQFAVSAFGGHFRGHLDGVCQGLPEAPKTPHVVEMKTHCDSSFRKLARCGVREAKPMHYGQMQVYMGMMSLTRALYIAVNKDNDELWTERVEFDPKFFKATMLRMRRIISTSTTQRCATRPDDWRCKTCPARTACWHDGTATFYPGHNYIDCRSCCHATADDKGDGHWSCAKGHNCVIGRDCACRDHVALPDMVAHESVESDDRDTLTYVLANGEKVTNGRGGFSSWELAKITADEVDAATKIKSVMPGATVGSVLTIPPMFEHFRGIPPLMDGTLAELKAFMACHNWQMTRREQDGDVEWFWFGEVNAVLKVEKKLDHAVILCEVPF